MITGFGVGQAPFMWYLRLLPAVSEAFAAIWGVGSDDLLCSFDGANVFRPWKYKPHWKTKGGWYHVDQNGNNYGKLERCCVQGLVTLHKSDEQSGGLVVIPGSHKEFVGVSERNAHKPPRELTKDDDPCALLDFVNIAEGDPVISNGGSLVCAEAGDLIVWDSRTVHCNSPALAQCESVEDDELLSPKITSKIEEHWDLIRMVGYICMTPHFLGATNDVLDKRWEAFVNNVTTSHWPHAFNGGTNGPYDMPPNDMAAIDDRQRRLIGANREPPSCLIEGGGKRNPSQLEGARLVELAEEAEGKGDITGAIRLYKRAYKLDPSLEFN
eukprot:CAMPEP_0194448020 /NCGR_PEP_ID=MMETSP0176-20130528/129335_1 /TAXON_ID=216777 /ORGANISM="Proboscia alata, Strain PI-D3" /LENGTH=325 /DNA_ID=CAMNT_0039274945 /DNA_START=1048 /DNA_END=2025 /DNA_ORIENTATION=-